MMAPVTGSSKLSRSTLSVAIWNKEHGKLGKISISNIFDICERNYIPRET